MRRVRTHTNPLKRFSIEVPDWPNVFEDPKLPFALEFGSSKGEFLIRHAELFPKMNILGTEIRLPLVSSVKEKIKSLGLGNAHILYGNIANRIEDFIPCGRIDRVYIFFPDPWPKKRHFKRRLITSELLLKLSQFMQKDSGIFIRTDHYSLFDSIMSACNSVSNSFVISEEPSLPIISAWEEHCLRTDRHFNKIYLKRN